jgi:hypothetical protein
MVAVVPLKAVHKGFPVELRTAAIMKGRLDLLMCQAFEHQADHADVDPGFAGSGQEVVFFTHPAVTSYPRDRIMESDRLDCYTYGLPVGLMSAGSEPAQDGFDLGECLLDRREVGRRNQKTLVVSPPGCTDVYRSLNLGRRSICPA